MKNKIDQSGFGFVEFLLILVVVAVLAVGGYYLWNKNHSAIKASNKSGTSSQNSNNNTVSSATSSTVINTTLGNTPQGLQTAVSNNLKSAGCILPNGNVANGPGDTTGTSLSSLQVYYMANTAAKINTCDAFSYYSDNNGSWNYDTGGQADFTCATLLKYNIPAVLVAAGSGSSTVKCVNSSGTGEETYTNN